jgi:hypothetical protein
LRDWSKWLDSSKFIPEPFEIELERKWLRDYTEVQGELHGKAKGFSRHMATVGVNEIVLPLVEDGEVLASYKARTNEIRHRDSKCGECGEELGRHAWISLQAQKGAVCLSCADLDHLVYLPSGHTALTRRARKNSRLSAVVLKWSRARKRYERQGLLVEEKALQDAEAECLADKDVREAARARAAERRA